MPLRIVMPYWSTILGKQHRLLMLHKPKGYVVTTSDELGRKTVYELLPPFAREEKWNPIGRLDMDSRGLLLFTRQGKIQDLLTKPGHTTKMYDIWLRGHITEEHLQKALQGIQTPDGILKAAKIERLGGIGHKSHIAVELDEGKNRHLRKLFGNLSDPETGTPLKVLELKRIQIGNMELDIPSGKWRFLTESEEAELMYDF